MELFLLIKIDRMKTALFRLSSMANKQANRICKFNEQIVCEETYQASKHISQVVVHADNR